MSILPFVPPVLILQTGQPTATMRRHGSFAHWIRVAAGLAADAAVVVDVAQGEPLPGQDGFSAVIITGSAAMVTDRHGWSERSAAWLAQVAHAGLPLLGICYGHQLLAHALGGEVGDNPNGREMGTVEIVLHEQASEDVLLSGLPPRFFAQATHLQSVLQPPAGATVLARNDHDACHAFRWGQSVWGVQFHPEFSTTHMRGYIRARWDVLREEGRDPRRLEASVRATPLARQVLRRFVRYARGRWLC
jgi:GMP synthase (glutamine-hydrolysing)